MKRIITFDSTPGTFCGPIVDWCKSLRNSTVCEIKLLSGSKSSNPGPLWVIVSLQDGSMYRLQRTMKWAKKQILPDFQDTIEKISSPEITPSQPLAAINFKQIYRPSLLSLLRICHGIQKHGLIFKAPHVVMDCSDDFFALALVLNVTRSCIPPRNLYDALETDCSPLETLWQDIYRLLQRKGDAFWEDTIAEHTKNLARELVYRLGRLQAVKILGKGLDHDTCLSVAASTIARIEALVENKELADLTLWDKAWDIRWKGVWKQHKPMIQQRNRGAIQSISRIAGGKATVSVMVDGRTIGRTAGRTPVKLSLSETSAILLKSVLAGSHDQPPGTPMYSLRKNSIDQSRGQNTYLMTSKPHPTAEMVTPTVYNAALDERLDCAVNWLGHSCLLLSSGNHQIWATPRENAIEFAWAAAWSEAISQGKAAAENVLNSNIDENSPQIQPHTGARSRAYTTAHPSVLGAIWATETVVDYASRASRRFSLSFNAESHNHESSPPSGANLGQEVDQTTQPSEMSPTVASSPAPAPKSPSINAGQTLAPRKLVPSIRINIPPFAPNHRAGMAIPSAATPTRKASASPSTRRQSNIPDPNLQPILEAQQAFATSPMEIVENSRPFPTQSPVQTTMQPDLDPTDPPGGTSVARPRSESAKKRLQRHVVSRWSDSQRYSGFEDAFVEKTKERHYREKKEKAQVDATARIKNSSTFSKIHDQLRGEGTRQAQEAWELAVKISGQAHFDRKLRVLAQQEWEKLVEQHNRSFSTPLEDDPTWEGKFISAWQEAWKKSWTAAWTTVGSQAYKEAILKGIEFGIEETLDANSKLGRKTYEELQKRDSYRELSKFLSQIKLPSQSLEQIHQWIKELGYLYESLRYSVPTLRGDCMEITVFESHKPKLKPATALLASLGTNDVKFKPIIMSHFDFQKWIANDCISRKIRDQKVRELFLRGIAEVWDSVSEINYE